MELIALVFFWLNQQNKFGQNNRINLYQKRQESRLQVKMIKNKVGLTKSGILNPGPGSYEIPSSLKVQQSQSKQSNQKRFRPYQTLVPGPGQYDSSSSKVNQFEKQNSSGPKALILSRIKQHMEDSIPGPGAYQPDFKKTMKSQGGYQLPRGLRSTFQNKNQAKMPGPGSYQTAKSTLMNQKNGIGFGPERNIKLADQKNVPGPGQYNTSQNKFTIQNTPSSIFSKAIRSQSYNSLGPGPGSYKATNQFQNNAKKGFSISFKHNNLFQKNNNLPGPGAYYIDEVDKIMFKSSSFSMPKSPRLKSQMEKQLLSVPGPQRYNVNLKTFQHKSYKLGSSKRKALGQDNNFPGPGAYQIKNAVQMPKFSVPRSSLSWIKSNTNPGPGVYNPKVVTNTQYQSVVLSKDERRPFYDEKRFVPGPGQYTITQMMTKKGGFKLGNQKRSDLGGSRQKIPGPGQYNVKTKLKGSKDI